MISSDNIQGGFLATRELMECGCENILLLTSRKKAQYTKKLFHHCFPHNINLLMNRGNGHGVERKRVRMMAMQNVCSLVYVSGGMSNIEHMIKDLMVSYAAR